MGKRYNRALTIAGSDSSGGAGVQADLKTFSALGCYGLSAITALTAQNTQGVRGIQEIPAAFVSLQIRTVLEDVGADVIKIGMLFNSEIIREVAECLQSFTIPCVVVDPVMVAKGGDRLLREDAMQSLRDRLIPMATVLTPNLAEAEALLGRSIKTHDEMGQAAKELCRLGAKATVVKGGNLAGKSSDDCLCVQDKDGREIVHWLEQPRIETANVHGTGCTFSSAIAAYLAKGYEIEDAVRQAKSYVTEALQAGAEYKLGQGKGPVKHFYKTWEI